MVLEGLSLVKTLLTLRITYETDPLSFYKICLRACASDDFPILPVDHAK